MPVLRHLLLAAATLSLPACATRGTIDIPCKPFKANEAAELRELDMGRLVREIQQEAAPPSAVAPEDDPLVKRVEGAILQALSAQKLESLGARRLAPANTLLLSGGGQWGSFGAGFLHELNNRPDARLPDFDIVTGVSTGGLQSLFVALGDLPVSAEERRRFEQFLAQPGNAHIPRPSGHPTYIDLLQMNYSPLDEREIVSRNAKWKALYKGSFAGLKPLRARIERALCAEGDPAKGCPMIEHLAKSGKVVLIGFIRVNDGRFVYADAVKLARLIDDPTLDASRTSRLATIQQCLTGAALASAAMPVTFQQVRINSETYLDGGVRRSVFDARVVHALERAAQSASAQIATKPDPDTLTGLYVIRNGPTSLKALEPKPGSAAGNPRHKVDDVMIVTDVIERAQAIVVNELEVGSIAGLRLERPRGDIWLATADGYDRAFPSPAGGGDEICRKENPQAMFEPAFMRCLQRFGRYKASRNFETDPGAPKNPWLRLSPVAPPSKTVAGDPE